MSGRNLEFGAGIWLFQQFVDRYATDAYGPPVGTLEAFERAAQAGDSACLDINYPFAGARESIRTVRQLDAEFDQIDLNALRQAQQAHDALGAQRIVLDLLPG